MPEYQVIGGRVVARGPTGTGTLEGLIADLQGMKAALALKAEKTELPEVLDVLDSDRADAALSAAQGKTLKTMIDAVPVTEIVNNLSAGGADKALSAAMGKKLNQAIAKKLSQDDVLDVLDSDRTDAALSAKQGKALSQALAAKADLVNGKVPLAQLPPGGAGPSVEVIDALDSNRADAALSARQGKVLAELIDGGIPRGFIGMWSGQLSEIPSGWALCDGQDGRPNLLGKFIRGVPAATNPGNTGGSDSITLSEANLPAHRHNVNAETTGHSHTISGIGQGMLKVGGNQNAPALVADSFGTPTSTVKDRINTSSSTVGGGQAFDNRPAYYELAYIIKL